MKSRQIKIVAVIAFLVIGFGIGLTIRFGASREREHNKLALDEVAAGIELETYHTVQKSLQGVAKMPILLSTVSGELLADNDEVLIALRTIRAASDASIVYVMNAAGLTVACTPFDQGKTLTGHNYAFRPYFSEVMATGNSTIYGALGVTTGERGFYIGVPITAPFSEELRGVAVAKIGLGAIDQVLKSCQYPCALLSDDGIVFASNRSDWLFKAGFSLKEEQRKKIIDSRQFANEKLDPLVVDLRAAVVNFDGSAYRVESKRLKDGSWRLISLFPWQVIDFGLLALIVTILFVVCGSLGFGLIYFQRLRLSEQRFRALFTQAEKAKHDVEKNRNQLKKALDSISRLIWEIIENENLNIWYENLHLEKCYEITKCAEEKCVLFGKEPMRCWLETGTFCGGEKQDNYTKKIKDCRLCEVYKNATIEPHHIIGEQFNTMMHILQQKNRELQLQEERNRAVLRTANDAIILIDSTGTVLSWNLAAEKLFGFTKSELIGKSISVIVPPGYRNAHTQALAKIAAGGKGKLIGGPPVELVGLKADGSEVPVELSLAQSAINGQLFFTGIVRDITERKLETEKLELARQETAKINLHLEDAVLQARAMELEAQMASAAKSEFVANMSHEIRTPMNGVIGMTNVLLDTCLTERQREYAGIILSSADLMLSLINDILDISKIEAGKLELEKIDFDLRVTLDDTIDLLSLRAEEKGLELICLVDSEVPSLLLGDPVRIRQVLVNMVGNAVKFTVDGEIVIRVNCVSAEDDFVLLCFAVTDTGIGIPEDRQELLFESFTQVDTSTTRKFGGTGLGLSISKQLAEMMGGEIGVKSKEGVGSTFWITAKLQKQAMAGGTTMAEEAGEAGSANIVTRHSIADSVRRQVRILLVEDNIVNQQVAQAILENFGFQADVANNGAEALTMIEENVYHLILMDCQMPIVDGYEATAKIRQLAPEKNKVPVIAMTAHAMGGDREKCIKAGMNDYLSKPIDPRKLAMIIEKWASFSVERFELKEIESSPNETGGDVMIFDRAAFLKLFHGNESTMKMILGSFIKNVPEQLVELKDALASGDAAKVSFHAHSIKGAAGNAYAGQLRDAAFELEKKGKSGDLPDLNNLLVKLEQEWTLLLTILNDELNPLA